MSRPGSRRDDSNISYLDSTVVEINVSLPQAALSKHSITLTQVDE